MVTLLVFFSREKLMKSFRNLRIGDLDSHILYSLHSCPRSFIKNIRRLFGADLPTN